MWYYDVLMFEDAVQSFRRIVHIACAILLACIYLFLFADYMQTVSANGLVTFTAEQSHPIPQGSTILIHE